jgi:hypothetical protein
MVGMRQRPTAAAQRTAWWVAAALLAAMAGWTRGARARQRTAWLLAVAQVRVRRFDDRQSPK